MILRRYLLLVWCVGAALGAVPPLSPETAFAEAEVVVVGVLETPSVEEVEQREGVVNAVATSPVAVMAVEKGAPVASVSYWYPLERPAGFTGHQGQSPRPPSGVPLRLFAKADGELLIPNGWLPYDGPIGSESDIQVTVDGEGVEAAPEEEEAAEDPVSEEEEEPPLVEEDDPPAKEEEEEEEEEQPTADEEPLAEETPADEDPPAVLEELEVLEEDPATDVVERKHSIFGSPWRTLWSRITALGKRLRNLIPFMKKKP